MVVLFFDRELIELWNSLLLLPFPILAEVTGYVIEEQFYSDDKSPPRHERKELIYSSNPDELATLQQQLERKSLTDSSDVKVERQFKQITGTGDAIDTQLAIGDASERFIRKESNSSSSHHSHLQSQFESQIEHELTADETEDSESNDVCSVIEVEQPQLRQTSSSTTSRSSATRSFLNTSGEDRHVSGVDDVLERMRNADNGKWILLLQLLLFFHNLLLIFIQLFSSPFSHFLLISCCFFLFCSCGAWRQYRGQRSTCSAQQVSWRQRHHAGRREYVASGTETAIAESQQRQQQQQPSGKSAPPSISGSKAPSGSALMDEPIFICTLNLDKCIILYRLYIVYP